MVAWAARCCAMPRLWFNFQIFIRISNWIFSNFLFKFQIGRASNRSTIKGPLYIYIAVPVPQYCVIKTCKRRVYGCTFLRVAPDVWHLMCGQLYTVVNLLLCKEPKFALHRRQGKPQSHSRCDGEEECPCQSVHGLRCPSSLLCQILMCVKLS